MGATGPFIKSHVYRLVTLSPPQRKPREWCLTYLGDNDWSARPVAGTLQINPMQIIDWTDLGPNLGRDDQRHFINRQIKDAPSYTKHEFVRPEKLTGGHADYICAQCGFDYDNRLHQFHT
jgi:hypothetical protein